MNQTVWRTYEGEAGLNTWKANWKQVQQMRAIRTEEGREGGREGMEDETEAAQVAELGVQISQGVAHE